MPGNSEQRSDFDYERLGLELRIAREAKGVNRASLARLLKISEVVLARYESGERGIPLHTLSRYVKAIDAPLVPLLQRAGIAEFDDSVGVVAEIDRDPELNDPAIKQMVKSSYYTGLEICRGLR